jgi:predicted transcriptional regulator
MTVSPTSRETASHADRDELIEESPRHDQGHPPGANLDRGLGQREREIMSVLLAHGSATVQQVSERLSDPLAYTTVMTTLDRLFKKGFLQREKRSRAFLYSTTLTAREIEDRRAASLVRHFFADSGERSDILLSCLVDAVHRYDTTLLNQLESKISAARERHLASTAETGGYR